MTPRLASRLDGVERTLIRRIFDTAPPDAINLGLGQPDLPTLPAAARAGIEAVERGRTGYTSTAGDPALRSAIAEAYAPFATGPESVLVTVGTQEAMFSACLGLLDPGDEILVPDPGYPAYPVVARLLGARAVGYALRPELGFRIDPADLLAKISPRTRAAILCLPSNPTGACATPAALAALLPELERRGVTWLSDEVYAGFSYDGAFVSPARVYGRGGLVIGGVSKDASMTGWRVGWIVGPEATIARLVAAHQYVVTCAPAPSQHAARAVFGEQGRRELAGYVEVFARRRRVMGDALAAIPRLRFEPPDGAFYYFVDVSAYGASLELARRALERRKVVTIPGEAFGSNGSGWLRLSFACSEQGIVEGVRRLGEELTAGA